MLVVSLPVSIVALSFALLATAFSQTLYKSYFMDKRLYKLLGCAVLFAMIPVASYFALQNMGVHYVYTSTAISQVIIIVLAKLLLGEAISKRKTIAVSLIVVGIVLFNFPVIFQSLTNGGLINGNQI